MTTANLTRPTIAAGVLIRRAFVWWVGELAPLLPAWVLRRQWQPGYHAIILEVTANGVLLVLPKRGSSVPVHVPLDSGDTAAARASVQSALRRFRAGTATIIQLDPNMVLNASIVLPAAAEGNLREILEHQIDQLVPMSAEDVYFVHAVAPRLPADRTITAHLAIATKSSINWVLKLAHAVGLDPRQVVVPALPPTAAEGRDRTVALLQMDRRSIRTGRWRYAIRSLELLVILLATVALGLYVHALDVRREQLRTLVRQASADARVVHEVARDVARSRDALSVLDARWASPSPLKVLNDLAELLPDSIWIDRFVLHDGQVEITGTAPRATDLIGLMEGSTSFDKPAFRSAITLAPEGKGERFELSFTLREVPPR